MLAEEVTAMTRSVAGMLVAGLALTLFSAACAAPAGGNDPMGNGTPGTAVPAGSRFIVKYRAGSGPARDTAAVQQRLDGTAPPGLALTWQRRLGVQADLFTTSRPLDPAETEALMQRFRDDPDVEYVEADGMMGIDPIRRGAPVRPLD
jgi:hypothetical protein